MGIKYWVFFHEKDITQAYTTLTIITTTTGNVIQFNCCTFFFVESETWNEKCLLLLQTRGGGDNNVPKLNCSNTIQIWVNRNENKGENCSVVIPNHFSFHNLLDLLSLTHTHTRVHDELFLLGNNKNCLSSILTCSLSSSYYQIWWRYSFEKLFEYDEMTMTFFFVSLFKHTLHCMQ